MRRIVFEALATASFGPCVFICILIRVLVLMGVRLGVIFVGITGISRSYGLLFYHALIRAGLAFSAHNSSVPFLSYHFCKMLHHLFVGKFNPMASLLT